MQTVHGLLAYKQNWGVKEAFIVYIITDQSINRLEFTNQKRECTRSVAAVVAKGLRVRLSLVNVTKGSVPP